MANSIHVNGAALCRTGTASMAALEDLGYSQDGIDIEIEDMTEAVFCDLFGPKVPFDEQAMLQVAHIRGIINFYTETTMAKMRANAPGATEGTPLAPGTLYGAGGKYFRLLITSPTEAVPFNFLTARVDGAKRVKLGTKAHGYSLSWFAIPYTGSTSTPVLYNQTAT